MPLTYADLNKIYVIKRIGGNSEIQRHLRNLGFLVDEKIRVISIANGNVIVSIKDSRIALGENLAKKIFI